MTTNSKETIPLYNNSNNNSNNYNNNILATQGVADKKQIDELIDMFKSVNPSYQKLFGNPTQRKALERLVKVQGEEKIRKIIEILPQTNKMKYSPTICTPVELENKLGNLIAFIQKEKSEQDKNEIISL